MNYPVRPLVLSTMICGQFAVLSMLSCADGAAGGDGADETATSYQVDAFRAEIGAGLDQLETDVEALIARRRTTQDTTWRVPSALDALHDRIETLRNDLDQLDWRSDPDWSRLAGSMRTTVDSLRQQLDRLSSLPQTGVWGETEPMSLPKKP
ncbi:MAG TPA: hypothetical protein VGA22_07750 [Gemmatimonadales bacterium]